MRKFAVISGFLCLTVIGILLFVQVQDASKEASAQGLPVRARFPQVAADSASLPATATPTRTATSQATTPPSATATATKTLVPAPTATPQPAGVYAHGGRWYVSSTGTVRVVGLVTNGLSVAIDFVRVTANFYSASGQLLATDFTFADVDTIAAGGSSPYTVLLFDPPAGIASVDVLVSDYDTDPFEPVVTGLIIRVTNIYASITGTVHVVGTVTNNSLFGYEFVKPIGAFVDSDGLVIRTDFTFTSPNDLAPGATGTYDMLFFDPPPGMVGQNLLIWVDANRE